MNRMSTEPDAAVAALNDTGVMPAGPLTVEVAGSESELRALRGEWDQLVLDAPARIYQSYEWLSLWWKYFGGPGARSLHVVCFRTPDRRLVGIVPCYVHESRIAGVRVRRSLRFLGTGEAYVTSQGLQLDDGPSDYCDGIVMPAFAAASAAAFVDHLTGCTPGFDEFVGVEIPSGSRFFDELAAELRRRGIRHRVSQGEKCSAVEVPASIDEYLARVHPSVRRRLSQAMKACRTGDPVRIVLINDESSFAEAFGELAGLHQRRWNSMGYPGLFWDPRSRMFQEEAARAFLGRGWLWCAAAVSGGKYIAIRSAFRFKDRWYDYLTGFDDRSPLAKARPGLGILVRMIEDAAAARANIVDLLRGDEAYKAELTPLFSYNRNITVSPGAELSGVKRMVEKAVTGLLFLGFSLRKEWTLVRVQNRVHGPMRAVVRYCEFRLGRLRRKMSAASEQQS